VKVALGAVKELSIDRKHFNQDFRNQ